MADTAAAEKPVCICLEGRMRALIYEFMPNGSLDKLIYRKGPETITPLSWDIMYETAIVLPKISDFGLAKLSARNESIISMSDARGTIGDIFQGFHSSLMFIDLE
ncbi:LEAF RUST 10 DISEASE-RESISTANCE LOCUS RECEPTOR-LIKE PROTEIN KINASE-like 2.4 [Glycine soja]|uniref:LEAF RUST 10 DISEASE-RESISTANCE LOCUS RECEPTOR-LIKE PROTEIN KINASE-like 2.4 n=1 Tax=Glycine soja TaxID=3848 RepID=A0A445JUI7_GLYSO|nr:LEAF RUST 10 DISEASE-RESISTANCE LOCUS RECEPTOR-LIKE PROTEIN KINASE-like 2.4 [Glycine soja]